MTASGTLLIGYGNPGRGDDGLGPAFAHRIAGLGLPDLTVEIDYQVTVEHALLIAGAETVVFADAALDADSAFYFRTLDDSAAEALGSHSVTPEGALKLARVLFGGRARGFVLGLSGSAYGMVSEDLSAVARQTLDLAERFFVEWYGTGRVAPKPEA